MSFNCIASIRFYFAMKPTIFNSTLLSDKNLKNQIRKYCLVLLLHLPVSLHAQSKLPMLDGTMQIELDTNQSPSIVRGTFNFYKNTNQQDVCFLIPTSKVENPIHRSLLQRLRAFEKTSDENQHLLDFAATSTSYSSIHGNILRFNKSNDLKIEFSFVTRYESKQSQEWFYQRSLPLPLLDCPNDLNPRYNLSPTHFSVQISTPEKWNLIAPNHESFNTKTYRSEIDGQEFSFVLFKSNLYHNLSSLDGNLRIYSETLNPEFLLSLAQVYQYLKQLFGPLPSKRLTIVESSSLHLKNAPGLITISKPRQKIFESLQKKYLNWEYWVLASKMAQQWYGKAIQASRPEESWFIDGMSEFATSEAFRNNPRRANIFNSWDQDFSYFAFNYEQFLNFSTSWLFQKNFYAKQDNIKEHSSPDSAYLKNVLALKQLQYTMGTNHFQALIKSFTQENLNKTIGPDDFIRKLRSHSERAESQNNITQQMKNWWSDSNWVKLKMLDFDTKQIDSNKWHTKITFQKNIHLTIPLQIEGYDGKKQLSYLDAPANAEGIVNTDILTDFKPQALHLDPHHEIFQIDRFESSSDGAHFDVIPGSGHTFSDQNYTILWAPIAMRNPGEQTSLGIKLHVLKYLQSSFDMTAETMPSNHTGAYQFNLQRNLLDLEAKLKGSTSLDYYGKQLSSIGLIKTVNASSQSLTLSGHINNRRTVGQPKTAHQSLLLGSTLDGWTWSHWSPTLALSIESSPGNNQDIHVYHRTIINPQLSFHPNSLLNLNLKTFIGRVYSRKLHSTSPLFRVNDSSEAGLRIDDRNLSLTKRIDAATLEGITPLPIPHVASSIFLLSKLRLKLFYDIGFVGNWAPATRLSASGASLVLPLGGDVMGAGTLVLSNFSLTGVFFTEIFGERSYKPRWLFNLSGNI